MDYRKIIGFGKSSYVVSLPKSWLVEKNLKKGDVLYVCSEGDKLSLYPTELKKSQNLKKITMDVTDMTNTEIKLHLISEYIKNFNEISFVTKDMKSKAKDIRVMIHNMMALEVIAETANKIVTKDFLNMEDISPLDILHKMDVITRGMLSDSKKAFNEDNPENISERDTDVNRLSFLLFRSIRYLQNNPAVARKRKLGCHNLLVLWVAAVKIENVADQAKRLAKLMRRVKFKKVEQEEFFKLYSTIEKYYLDSIETCYNQDSYGAIRLIAKSKSMVKQCKDFYRLNWNYEWVPVMLEQLKSIVASSKSLLTYVCDKEMQE